MSTISRKLNSRVLLARPRITEKATMLAEGGKYPVYTFEVTREANKTEIRKAVIELYKVTPTRINIVNLPAKTIIRRGKKGRVAAIKKALVFLKAGEKIELA
jgi:large subunit ribosomal protein L23